MRLSITFCWLVLLAPHAPQAAPQATPPVAPQTAPAQPTFRSGVELLAVDVSVVDKDGRPVTGLTPADFTVEVGGRRRTVVRSEFIDFTQPVAASELADVSSNQADSSVPEPRTILLLVDDESFGPMDGKAVFMKLADSVERLFPRDPLGFAALSGRAKVVEFTTDRRPVADALRHLVGSRPPRLSVSTVEVALVEALDIVRNDALALGQVVGRECAGMSGPDLQICRDDVQDQSRRMVDEAEREAQATLESLMRVFEGLAPLPGTKYVLLVSQGIPVGRDQGLGSRIARAAAASGVTLHAFLVETANVMDASQQRFSPRAFEDLRVRADGLEMAVGAAGGALHRVIGDPTNSFERVRREMSAVYRLGVEVAESDADGRIRDISVKVTRPGTTARSHRQVVAPMSTAKLTPAERLTRSLQSPLVERDIPVRLGVFTYRDDNGAGRLLISAEADTAPEGLRVAFVLRDPRGKAINAGDLGADSVVSEKDAPTLILFNTPVPPGEHTLKLALVDAEGRTGSAVRPVSVPAAVPKPLALGDLLVLPGTTQANRARPSGRIPQGSRQASVYFELYSASPPPEKGALLLEIAEAPDAPALVSSRGLVGFKPRGGRLARAPGQLKFSPAALPPGRYFARLSVEGSDARAVRGFSVVAGSSTAALLSDESRALVPLFNVNRFLSEPLLQAVSERIARENAGDGAAGAIASALTDGSWRDLPPATGGGIADATLRGLQNLAAGDPAAAESAFRDALDRDPEFTLALALTGAAWASVGRDREASRSWRTSLATGVDAPFLYEQVTDALLRSGDVKGTREFLGELEEAGADVAPLARARALAAAISGDRRQAAAALGPWVDAHPEDHEASFLLVLALYELKTIEKDASVNAQFDARARQYVERGGPRQALVARWLK